MNRPETNGSASLIENMIFGCHRRVYDHRHDNSEDVDDGSTIPAAAVISSTTGVAYASPNGLVEIKPGDVVTDDQGRGCVVTSLGAQVPTAESESEWHERNLASALLWIMGSRGLDDLTAMQCIMAASAYDDVIQENAPGAPGNPFHGINKDGPYILAMGTVAYKDGQPVGYIGNAGVGAGSGTGVGISYLTLDYREAFYTGPASTE